MQKKAELSINDIAIRVIKTEAQQLNNLIKLLTIDFEKAIKAINKSNGKLIITGMGKSGIIGKKIAATLASTGTPSFFLHPGEAYHGDLGMIEKEDIVLLISNSGETDEILKLIPFLKFQSNITISMSGNPNSTLAKNTNYHLNIAVEKEACPLQLAPTSSTTATLVMGDAIAISLMELNGFEEKDFAVYHPGGNLGKKLLTKVKDLMRYDDLPICKPHESIKEVIHSITNGKCGLVVVQDDTSILGVVTDGDIRRAMELNESCFFDLKARDLSGDCPKMISPTEKITRASEMFSEYKINTLLVVSEEGKLEGVLQVYDIE